MQSGDWASCVPDLLTADGRLGVAIGEDVAEATQALETALDKLAQSDPWLRNHAVEISWSGGQFAPGPPTPTHR
jgi:acetylornithine deacetylase